MMSLPSRERGLKSITASNRAQVEAVAPFAGAWIEIISQKPKKFNRRVAPFAGAWIEIKFYGNYKKRIPCRSLRGSVD